MADKRGGDTAPPPPAYLTPARLPAEAASSGPGCDTPSLLLGPAFGNSLPAPEVKQVITHTRAGGGEEERGGDGTRREGGGRGVSRSDVGPRVAVGDGADLLILLYVRRDSSRERDALTPTRGARVHQSQTYQSSSTCSLLSSFSDALTRWKPFRSRLLPVVIPEARQQRLFGAWSCRRTTYMCCSNCCENRH